MNEVDLSLKRSTTESSQIGERLRYARESRELSQQEVSRALRLSVPVIDALERGAYEELPAPVFVRGYLKNYADLLRLPLLPEDIQIQTVAKYTKNYAEKSTQFSVMSILSVITHLFIKLLYYIVFPVLLLLIFFWWHENHPAVEKVIVLPKVNVASSQEDPFPQHIRPIPPDLSPWLDDVGGVR